MKLLGSAIGLTAFSLGAVAVGALMAGNRYLDQWENLELDECGHGEFCTLNNGWRLHFSVHGEGLPIVLLHGFNDSLSTWRENVGALAAQHRVISIDMPGFGFSERVREPVYSLKQMSRVLGEFLERQGIDRATLVGHSMGGALAVQYTYDFPERVDKLVLEAAAVYLRVPSAKSVLERMPRAIPRGALGLYSIRQELIESAMINAHGEARRISRQRAEHRVRSHRVRGTMDALLAILESPRDTDLPEAIAKIQQPTLVIWGDRDWVVPLRHGYRLRRELPHSRLAIFSEAGHLLHEEYPEQVNQLVLGFLERGLEGINESEQRS